MTTKIPSAPVTVANISEVSPELLRSAIDQRITRIRPTSTPIDQLTRCASTRRADSMKVEYYSVDTKPTTTLVSRDVEACVGKGSGAYRSVNVYVENPEIFEPSETLLAPEVKGEDGMPLVLYVVKVGEDNITVIPLNGPTRPEGDISVVSMPALSEGTSLERMGRAATELDVQTAQFATIPVKTFNNCQIFKMQVEQSTLAKLASKEVAWSFSDQEEAAVIDMRLGMEKSFIFGHRTKIHDPEKREDVFLTGGIWAQAGKQLEVNFADFGETRLLELCAKIFTGQSGSKRKILIGGSGLIEAINKINYRRVVAANDKFTKWGIEFREVVSNFGSLYVLHSEVFDQCGHENDGMVIDPDYMTKYVHIPFRADKLDLRAAGMRNTDAVVLTEASCLVLRYPAAHCRIIGRGA